MARLVIRFRGLGPFNPPKVELFAGDLKTAPVRKRSHELRIRSRSQGEWSDGIQMYRIIRRSLGKKLVFLWRIVEDSVS